MPTDLTSLAPGRDRLAIVIEMVVAPDGTVLRSLLFRALVHNRAQLAHDAVAAWLDGAGPAPDAFRATPGLGAQLRLQDRTAQALKARRHERGVLSLQTLEARRSAKGTWVRIFRPPVEGRVMRGANGLDVGDQVRVKLVGTDVERGFIDFAAD